MYFYLKQPNADKPTPIYLILYVKADKKNFKYSTGLKIHPDEWNAESRMPKAKRGAGGILNRRISVQLDKFVCFVDGLKSNLILSELRDLFDNEFRGKVTAKYLNDYFKEFIKEKKKLKSVGQESINKYNYLLDKLTAYQKKRKIKLKYQHLNESFYVDFIGFLRNRYDLYDNSLSRTFNFFKTFLLWSIRRGHPVSMDFKNVSVPKHDTDDIALSFQDLNTLESLKLTGADERARDVFLIGCYSGQRYSDYSVFESADVRSGMIIKRAEKTENPSYIPLHPKLKKLLDKYEWKLPTISSQKFNVNIQRVCKNAGFTELVKKVSFKGNHKKVEKLPRFKMVASHTARRTFITLSAERGMPDHVIMAITGIKDPKTLKKYKKVNKESVQDIADSIWG